MSNLNTFAQLTKIDEAKRLVYGRAAQEVPDHSDEVMDYALSKPNFEKWSTDMQKATDGASMGNVRAMHGNVAAGKLNELIFNDDENAIDVVAKIVDDNEWQKCLEGVYTGFSIGGKYGATVMKGDMKHYEAIPSEISLVDRPCIPTATFFDIKKADGVMQKVAFKSQPVAKSDKEIEYEVTGTAEDANELAKILFENKLSIADAVKAVSSALGKAKGASEPEAANPIDPKSIDNQSAFLDPTQWDDLTEDEAEMLAQAKENFEGSDALTKMCSESADALKSTLKSQQSEDAGGHTSAADAHGKAAAKAKADDRPKSAKFHAAMAGFHGARADSGAEKAFAMSIELSKLGYDSKELHKLGESGRNCLMYLEKVAERKDVTPAEGKKKYGDVKFADEKNKKYPIDNEAHIRAAWNYINKEKNAGKYEAADLKTIRDNILAAWKDVIGGAPPSAEADKSVKVAGLKKDLYSVGSLGQILQTLFYLTKSAAAEAAREADGSEVPARLSAVAATLAGIYKDMATEESDELIEDLKGDGGDDDISPMMMALGLSGALMKVGARNSANDQDMIQKAHDLLSKLGANCATVNDPGAAAGSNGMPDTGLSADKTNAKALNGSDTNAADVSGGHVGGKAMPSGDMTKMDGWKEELSKAVSVATEALKKELDETKATLKKIADTPMPAKGVLRVVSKGDDIGAHSPEKTIEPVKKYDGTVDDVATALKKIHASGGEPLLGGPRSTN